MGFMISYPLSEQHQCKSYQKQLSVWLFKRKMLTDLLEILKVSSLGSRVRILAGPYFWSLTIRPWPILLVAVYDIGLVVTPLKMTISKQNSLNNISHINLKIMTSARFEPRVIFHTFSRLDPGTHFNRLIFEFEKFRWVYPQIIMFSNLYLWF